MRIDRVRHHVTRSPRPRTVSRAAVNLVLSDVRMVESTGSDATCTTAGITKYPGGTIITMSPALPASAKAGHTVFLYQRVRYDFATSTVLPGRRALWRTIVDTDTREDVALLCRPADAAHSSSPATSP